MGHLADARPVASLRAFDSEQFTDPSTTRGSEDAPSFRPGVPFVGAPGRCRLWSPRRLRLSVLGSTGTVENMRPLAPAQVATAPCRRRVNAWHGQSAHKSQEPGLAGPGSWSTEMVIRTGLHSVPNTLRACLSRSRREV